jgi:hypothetical protein
MRTQIEQAFLAGAETGIITLQITESQLTSYMTRKIAGTNQSAIHRPAGSASQRPNANVRKNKSSGMFTANMLITMNVGIDELTGQPKIEITSADFGPFPAPEGLNTAINADHSRSIHRLAWTRCSRLSFGSDFHRRWHHDTHWTNQIAAGLYPTCPASRPASA